MNTRNVFLLSIIIFTGLLFIIPRSFIPTDLGNTILTIVAFLFGIITGFYIVVTTTDYNSVKNILAYETAGLISLYQNIAIYDKEIANQLSLLIDKYIRRAFDFEIIDYAKSTRLEFETIEHLIKEIPIKENNLAIYQKIRENMGAIIITRQQLTVLGTKALSLFQWTILFILAILFILSLYGLRTGELFFDIVAVVVSSSIVLLLLLVRDLDIYIWNERTFGYDIFENVLISIGQLPYYPEESLKKKRTHPYEKEYRIGKYINFPKSTERKIEIHKID